MGDGKTISRLQRKLQRALDGGMNASKALRYLNELYVIPMTVDLLQETGVGKTVNQLSHMDGQVAQTAKSLVRKWRKLVKEVSRGFQGDSEAHEGINTQVAGDFKEIEPKRQKVEPASVHVDKRAAMCGHTPHNLNVSCSRHPDKKKEGRSMLVDEPVPIYTPNLLAVRATSMEGTETQHRKKVTVPDADIMIGSSRRSLSLVYSGKKRKGPSSIWKSLLVALPSADSPTLGEVGGVPYSILEPVLLKCSAVQLFHLEECNPYFLSDTDGLWKTHCQRDFKTSQPRVGQTWRELYLSKHSEREEKFKSLTKRIGQKVEAFQKEQKEKQVKLAKASSMKPKRSDNSVSLSSHHPSFQAGSIPKAHPMMTKVKKMISQQRMKGWRPC